MPAPIELPRYTFGPLERRGIVVGLQLSQLAALAGSCGGTLLALRLAPSALAGPLAIMAIALGLMLAFVSWQGRSLAAWLPLISAYHLRRMTGRHRFISRSHLIGHLVTVRRDGSVIESRSPEDRPQVLREISLLELQADTDRPVGVIRDARQHTYVGVMRVQGDGFCLADPAGQAAAVQAWASILASYASETSVVSRLQWIERTVPIDPSDMARHLTERALTGAPAAAKLIYAQAIAAIGEGRQHECLLAVRIDARRSWRQVRHRSQKDIDRGACRLLWRELAALRDQLDAAGITVLDILDAPALRSVIRTSYEPTCSGPLRVISGATSGAWPQHTTEETDRLESCGSVCHATYHVREWPRSEVGPTFLAPLLLDTDAFRTISMTMEPIPPARAARELRSAAASDLSDEQMRARGGWLSTFRHQREHDNVLRAEQELAAGHASYRFSAYVTVSAGSREELETACAEVEQAASRSQLELERLTAQQEVAFTYTLPLCEGLA